MKLSHNPVRLYSQAPTSTPTASVKLIPALYHFLIGGLMSSLNLNERAILHVALVGIRRGSQKQVFTQERNVFGRLFDIFTWGISGSI